MVETKGEAKNNVRGINVGFRALTHKRAPINFNVRAQPIKSTKRTCFLGTTCTKTNQCMRKNASPAMTGSSAAAKRAYARQICKSNC
tara:strand:+ start:198 stop:458 length:261 start_codon:yes stop_codon:yes gene_type:complete